MREDGKLETQEERAARYAPCEYIAAQLASNRPTHLDQLTIDLLPYAPQYGGYFGVRLLTKRALRHCEMIQQRISLGVLHVPLKARLPPEQPETVSFSQTIDFAWLWGYWVIDDERIPIVKSRQRPLDEKLLNMSNIKMPLRFAMYLRGILRPWQYEFVERWKLTSRATELKQQYGTGLVVQVLFRDIFSVLFAVERRVLYDPACLELLDCREWTSPYQEPHFQCGSKLFMFEKALRKYNNRIQAHRSTSGLGCTASDRGRPVNGNPVMVDNEEPLRRSRSR